MRFPVICPECGGDMGCEKCDPSAAATLAMDEKLIADTIRREVRRSAGIAEGQEFRCDWDQVARAVRRAVMGYPDCWGCDAKPPASLT